MNKISILKKIDMEDLNKVLTVLTEGKKNLTLTGMGMMGPDEIKKAEDDLEMAWEIMFNVLKDSPSIVTEETEEKVLVEE